MLLMFFSNFRSDKRWRSVVEWTIYWMRPCCVEHWLVAQSVHENDQGAKKQRRTGDGLFILLLFVLQCIQRAFDELVGELFVVCVRFKPRLLHPSYWLSENKAFFCHIDARSGFAHQLVVVWTYFRSRNNNLYVEDWIIKRFQFQLHVISAFMGALASHSEHRRGDVAIPGSAPGNCTRQMSIKRFIPPESINC